ncbi:DUF397 domain-containing protein [Saccharothrix xinjiangensis]|uniref:DUF397 domain-containing protein n=1 Tax=Saccharothrix xinjiangensis TaxID=204798 RepID=A0ABV9Y893_9PSEU
MSRDDPAPGEGRWRTSSHSGQDEGGVEVGVPAGPEPDGVFVRDAKDPGGGRLTFPARSFAAFIKAQRGPDRR